MTCAHETAVPLVDVPRDGRAVVCPCGARWPRPEQVPQHVARRLDALLGADAWRPLAPLDRPPLP